MRGRLVLSFSKGEPENRFVPILHLTEKGRHELVDVVRHDQQDG